MQATLDRPKVRPRRTITIAIPKWKAEPKPTGVVARVKRRIRLTKASLHHIFSKVWGSWIGRNALIFTGSFITAYAISFIALIPAVAVALLVKAIFHTAMLTEATFWVVYFVGLMLGLFKSLDFWIDLGEREFVA